MPEAVPNVLSIAGIDPSGGAGLYADLKTFAALRTYGCGVVAALTAQNTQRVSAVHVPPVEFLRTQLDTLFADVAIAATKTGMLATAAVIETTAERLAHWRAQGQSPILVVDPVMVAKSGDALLDRQAVGALVEALLPLATVITPNLPEAAVLLGRTAPESLREMIRAAEALRALLPSDGGHWVLLKGGHLPDLAHGHAQVGARALHVDLARIGEWLDRGGVDARARGEKMVSGVHRRALCRGPGDMPVGPL